MSSISNKTDKPKASNDYIKLRTLLAKGYYPIETRVDINPPSEKATITLAHPNKEKITFVSNEGDVILFSFALKYLYDQHGHLLIGEVNDLNKFYDEAKELFDPNNEKFTYTRNELIAGNIKVNYFPHLLFREFLEEKSLKNYKPYLKLKEDFYLIKVLNIEEMKMVYDGMQRIKSQKSSKTILMDLVLDLFKDAFHQDKNFLKNYHLFQTFNKVDVMNVLISTYKDKKITDSLFAMLHQRNGVPAEEGFTHIISAYATMAETINKLINIIRGAIELTEGDPSPIADKSSVENWEIIKRNPKYSVIVEEFDPRIRHGKAHNNFEIDVNNQVINFYNEGRIRSLSVSYTFEQIRIMWHRIHDILSALIIAVCLEQSALTGVILDSAEYKMSLLRLGNFKKFN